MRTTIRLDDDLLRQAKALAARTDLRPGVDLDDRADLLDILDVRP
jgi:hypothetical protein